MRRAAQIGLTAWACLITVLALLMALGCDEPPTAPETQGKHCDGVWTVQYVAGGGEIIVCVPRNG